MIRFKTVTQIKTVSLYTRVKQQQHPRDVSCMQHDSEKPQNRSISLCNTTHPIPWKYIEVKKVSHNRVMQKITQIIEIFCVVGLPTFARGN